MKKISVYSLLRVLTSFGVYSQLISKKNFITCFTSIREIIFSKFILLKTVANHKITTSFPQIRFSITELDLLIPQVPDLSTSKVLHASILFSYAWLTNAFLLRPALTK